MPLFRYFVFIGGALLALLFACDAMLPAVPLPSTLVSGSDLPEVRIRSDRKWPERVVFDTSAPIADAPVAAPVAKPAPATLADISAKAQVRDAFAQLPPAQPATDPKMSQMAQAKLPEPKTSPAKPQAKRKVAKTHVGRPVMLVAQQPHGFFDIW
jgi:hypothetical protein